MRQLISSLLFGCLTVLPSTHATERPSVETFLCEPEYRLPKLSPSGGTLALILRRDFTDSIVLLDVATMTPRPAPTLSNLRVLNYWWKGDQNLVLQVQEWFGDVYCRGFNLQTRKTTELRQFNTHHCTIINDLVGDDRHLLVTSGTETGRELQRYDITADKLEVVEKNPGWVHLWLTNREGRAVAGFGRTEGQWFMLVRANPSAKWRHVELGERSLPDFWPISLAPDSHHIIGYDYTTANTVRVVARDPGTGLDELLVQHKGLDPVLNVSWGDNSTQLRGVVYEADDHKVSYLTAADAQIGASIDRALPGKLNLVVSTSTDEKRLLIKSSNDIIPERYFLLDRGTGRLVPLGGTRTGLEPSQLVRSRYFEFNARDGLKVTARLILPAGTGNHALILDCGETLSSPSHHAYRPLAQLLASRGYAVLQVDHRGVDGHGRAFSRAGELNVHAAMADDLADGVRYAIDQGWADPRQIIMLGRNEAGVLAMHVLVRHPGLFAAWLNIGTPVNIEPVAAESLVVGIREPSLGGLLEIDALKLEKYAGTLDTTALLASLKLPSFHYYGTIEISQRPIIGSGGIHSATWSIPKKGVGIDQSSVRAIKHALKKSGTPNVMIVGRDSTDDEESVTKIDRRLHEETTKAYSRMLEFLATYTSASAH